MADRCGDGMEAPRRVGEPGWACVHVVPVVRAPMRVCVGVGVRLAAEAHALGLEQRRAAARGELDSTPALRFAGYRPVPVRHGAAVVYVFARGLLAQEIDG